MAKVIPIDTIKGLSGKVCSHSDTYFNYNHSAGTCYTGKICNPYTGKATAKQIAQQEAFKQKALRVSAWLNANKPSDTNGDKGTTAYQDAQRIKKTLQLANVRQVICRYIDAQGIVTLPASGQSVTPTPNPDTGGGGNTGGGGDSGGGGSF